MDYTQWSSAQLMVGTSDKANQGWIPPEDRQRILAYMKYDQMYWNDPRQYSLRVLDGEEPLYIPNARTVVDTTAHFLLKGLEITSTDEPTKLFLKDFLKREAFYSRFHTAKVSGVARGDFAYHLTANPLKEPGKRLSLNSVDPGNVFPIYDPDEPDKMIGVSLAVSWQDPNPDKTETYVRRLKYMLVEEGGKRRISREEAIFELDPDWFGPRAKVYKTILSRGLLDQRIQVLPVYWFKNKQWQGEDFGSSELRGLETIMQTISQGSTDVSAALALEGLGVYATDGGRPLGEEGDDSEWEVAPGKVMEVPSGAYFRRVDGVGSITPAVDQIKYLEEKINQATGLSDVALGKVDAQVAQSGIALAIKFMPTLAKIETRDQDGIDKLTQMFYDVKTWVEVFEKQTLAGDIVPSIGDKLPTDRVAKVNELNNMVDRKIIPLAYYRSEMEKLGYEFPADIETQLQKELDAAVQQAQKAFEATRDPQNSNGDDDAKSDSTKGSSLPTKGNKSNNRNRPNESAGTEA